MGWPQANFERFEQFKMFKKKFNSEQSYFLIFEYD